MSDVSDRRTIWQARFSLRELLLLVAVLGSLLALLYSKPHRQRRAVDAIRHLGGTVGETIGDGEGVPANVEEITSPLERIVLGDRATRVRSINLSRTKATDGDLGTLANFVDLQTLKLSHTRVRGPGLSVLRSLPRIETLDLEGTDVTDEFLAPLQELASLSVLNLKGTEITSESLRNLSKLKQLKILYLDNTDITDDGLRHLQGCTNLSVLSMEGTQVTIAGLSHLETLSNLHELEVQGLDLRYDDLIDAKSLAEKVTFVTRSDVVSAPQMVQAVLQAWKQREKRITSFAVEATSICTAQGESTKKQHQLAVDAQGRVRSVLLGNDGEAVRVYVFDGRTSRHLDASATGEDPVAMELTGGATDWLRMSDCFPYALAFRPWSFFGGQPALAISSEKAFVNDIECVVMYHQGGKLWVDPSREYILLRHAFIKRGRTYGQNDITYKQDKADWVPKSWTRSVLARDETVKVREEHIISNCLLNQTIGEEAFRIDYPDNTKKFIEQPGRKGLIRVDP
jgi:outer membrane lipoprotein-sorting protein